MKMLKAGFIVICYQL